MSDLLLTSTFSLDKTKSKVLVVGLANLSTAVLVIRSPRCPPFYITPSDWTLLSERFLSNDLPRKEDAVIFSGSRLQVTSTTKKQLVFSYHPSWIEDLLQAEAYSVTLSPLAANTLVALTRTINSLLQKLQSLIDTNTNDVVSNFDENAIAENMWQNLNGFYKPIDGEGATFNIQTLG
ncbi:Hypothetical protein NTJ_08500 [Nesidiocoris tenuis]|uniref:Uncharacterized protein n=1 Tax=Nesidiocoris tenuis TaxID=355587 RepID=A0ABN7ABE8_9HEMI|nr:Hypothetical protein NTJ_02456 [Nesidiocoris tenuis]BES95689.1 Hypothetical protein NTJ_08500 [Nesidiocoris tenuis]